VPKVDERTLRILSEAVRELIEAKEIGPEVGLSYVVWTPAKLLAAAKQQASEAGPYFYSAQTRKRGIELVAQGRSQREAAAEIGCPRTTLALWLRRDRRERGIEEAGVAAMPKGFRQHWEKSALSP
jgi:hypothetical protein